MTAEQKIVLLDRASAAGETVSTYLLRRGLETERGSLETETAPEGEDQQLFDMRMVMSRDRMNDRGAKQLLYRKLWDDDAKMFMKKYEEREAELTRKIDMDAASAKASKLLDDLLVKSGADKCHKCGARL
jgi:hypothetical protein